MNSAEKQTVLHCLKSMIDEALCEECPLYGTTGTDHCEEDCVRLAINALEQEPCGDAISRAEVLSHAKKDMGNGHEQPFDYVEVDVIKQLPPVTPAEKVGHWIPVSERLPELNRPLLVTAYHRVYYGHLISESGNYGYPIFRIHGLGDKNRDWVQETMSHEPYSLGRIDAWMYFDIPEPYKASPTGEEVEE